MLVIPDEEGTENMRIKERYEYRSIRINIDKTGFIINILKEILYYDTQNIY